MPTYSAEQLALIDAETKPTQSLPKYYLADTKQSIPISRDFEAYLILQPSEQKQNIVDWINGANEITNDTVDRDELASQYFDLRIADAKQRISDLDEQLNNFNKFKLGLLGTKGDPSGFSTITEINLMTRALQKPLDEMVYLREQAFHEQTMNGIQKLRAEVDIDTPDTQKELESWQKVITTYPGQESSSGASLANNSIPLPISGGGLL